MLHIINESSLDGAVCLCSILRALLHLHPWRYRLYLISSSSLALSIKRNTFNSTISILATLHMRMKVSFAGFGKSLNSINYDGRCMLLSRNLPVRHPHPAFALPSPFHKRFTLTCFILVSLPPWCRIVSKYQLQSKREALFFLGKIHLVPVGGTPSSLLTLPFWWLGGAGLGIPKDCGGRFRWM